MKTQNQKLFCLVYQAGIANVFENIGTDDSYEWKRVMQWTFKSCEDFCRGAKAAGAKVKVAWCNEAGEIINSHWRFSEFHNAPFNDSFASDFIPRN